MEQRYLCDARLVIGDTKALIAFEDSSATIFKEASPPPSDDRHTVDGQSGQV
jgi:hypothetical protein